MSLHRLPPRLFQLVCAVIVLFCFIQRPLPAQTALQWEQTGPYGGRINCFATIGATLFAGGNGVFRSMDNGTTWMTVGLTDRVTYSLVVSGTTLFAGTSSGIFRSLDNGTTWTAVNTGLGNRDIRSLAVSGSTLFAGTNIGGLFRSLDSGTTWTAVNVVNSGFSNLFVFSLLVNGSTLFAGTNGGVFRSTNNGATWTAINTGLTDRAVYTLTVNGAALFVGTNSGVSRSVDNGTTWMAVNTGLQNQPVISLGVSGTALFAGTLGSGVYRSTDNGTTWTAVNTGLSSMVVHSLTVSGTALLAGTNGGVYRSTNNGTAWTGASVGLPSLSINSLLVNGTTLFAAATGGVHRSTDNGTTWTEVSAGLPNLSVNSLTTIGTTLFAGTDGGGVYRSMDNGATWTLASQDLTFSFVNVLVASGNALFAGTFGDGVFRSTDNGTTWTEVNTGLGNNSVFSLVASGSTIFIGTGGGGIFRSIDSGRAWTAVNVGLTDRAVYSLAANATTLFAGTFESGVFRSTDNGMTWVAVNSGLTNMTVRSLSVIGLTVFAGTDGGVFRSTDNGMTWTAVNSGLTAMSIRTLAVSGTMLFAGTVGGGVWRTSGITAQISLANSVAFGSVRAGRDSVIAVQVRNTGVAAGIFSAAISGINASDFSLVSPFQGVSLAAGASTSVSVRFRPAAGQTSLRTATLQIRQNNGQAQADTTLSGTALQPAYQLSQSSLAFGILYTTQPALRQTLRITNTGTAAGEIQSLAVSPVGDFTPVSFRRQTLTVGGFVDIEVVFLPQSAGAKRATLSIIAEGAEAGTMTRLEASLTGEGRALPAPVIVAPFDGRQDMPVSSGVTLTWNPVDNAESYTVQIAYDNAMTRLIDSATVTTTSYTLRNLNRDAQYFWRVRSQANIVQNGITTTIFSSWNVPKAAVFQTESTPNRPRLRADTSVIDFGRVSIIQNNFGQGRKSASLSLRALNSTMRLERVRLDTLSEIFDIQQVQDLNNTDFVPGIPRTAPIFFKAPPPGRVYAANLMLRASPTDSSIVVLRGQGTLCVDTANGRQICPSTTIELRLVGRQPANPLDTVRFQVWLTNVNLLGMSAELLRFVRRLRTTLSFTNNSMITVRSVVPDTGFRATLVSPRTLPNIQNAYTVIWEWLNPREILSRTGEVKLGEFVARTTLGDTNTTKVQLTEARWLDASSDNAETTREVVVLGADTTLTLRTRYFPVPTNNVLTLLPPLPNPANEETSITYTLSKASPVTIVVADVLGRTLFRREEGIKSEGNHEVQIPLSDIPRGTYYIFLATSNTTRGERLEVKR